MRGNVLEMERPRAPLVVLFESVPRIRQDDAETKTRTTVVRVPRWPQGGFFAAMLFISVEKRASLRRSFRWFSHEDIETC